MRRRDAAARAAIVCGVCNAYAAAQLSLATARYDQNFNDMGIFSDAPLAQGWRMSAAGAGGAAGYSTNGFYAKVSQAANSGGSTAAGRYNWGTSGNTADRALGFMTGAGYASPNSIWFGFTNHTGSTITAMSLSFDYERYRVNSDAAGVAFAVSATGSTWTTVPAGDSVSFPTGASQFTFGSPLTVHAKIEQSNLAIAEGQSYYFRWLFTSTTNAPQGIGLDNVAMDLTLQAIPEPLTAAGVLLLVTRVLGRRGRAVM